MVFIGVWILWFMFDRNVFFEWFVVLVVIVSVLRLWVWCFNVLLSVVMWCFYVLCFVLLIIVVRLCRKLFFVLWIGCELMSIGSKELFWWIILYLVMEIMLLFCNRVKLVLNMGKLCLVIIWLKDSCFFIVLCL